MNFVAVPLSTCLVQEIDAFFFFSVVQVNIEFKSEIIILQLVDIVNHSPNRTTFSESGESTTVERRFCLCPPCVACSGRDVPIAAPNMHLPTVAEPCNRILFCAYLFFIRFSSRSLVSSAKRSSCHRITFNLTAILVTITILLTTQLALYNAFLLPPAYSPADAVAFPSPTTTTYFEEYSTESTDNGPLVTSPPSFSDLYPNLASLKSLLSHRLEQATSGNHNEDTIDSTDLSNANDFSPKDVAAGEQRSPGARSSSPNADGRSPANDHNGWMSEDLLPKEKSIINIKLVKRVRPHINVATDRDARTYLSDPQLDFESSFAEHHAYGCRIRVRRAISRSSNTNEFVAQSYSQLLHKPLGPLQAEITVDLHHNAAAFKVSSVAATAQSSSLTENGKSAYLKTHPFNATSPSSLSSSSSSHFNRSQIVDGPDETTPCSQLPLHILRPYAHNLTQLVVFNTNVRRLRRFEFGSARLDKLQRLDIIHNRRLLEFEQRSFDGLARLEYLAVINNARLQHIPATAFAGAKQLQELLLIGNGNHWSSDYLHMLLRSATASILPNLVHLHVRGVPLPSFTPDQWARADAWRMLRRFEKLYGLEAISSYRPLVLPSQYEHIWHPFDPSDWVDSEEDRMNVTADTDELRRGFGCGSNCNHRRLSGQIEAQQHMPDSNGIKLGRDAFAQLYQIRYLQLEYADLMHLHSEVLLPLIGNLSSLNLAGNTKLTGENLRNMLSTHNTAIKNHNSKASAAERIDVL